MVEAGGVEPPSWGGTASASTCVACLEYSSRGLAADEPNHGTSALLVSYRATRTPGFAASLMSSPLSPIRRRGKDVADN